MNDHVHTAMHIATELYGKKMATAGCYRLSDKLWTMYEDVHQQLM